jgi:anthranilate synthase component I
VKATCLSRHLSHAPDPAALYQLIAHSAPGTLLFETGDTADGSARRCILVPNVAVRLECHGACVTLTARSAQGTSIIREIATKLHERVTRTTDTELELTFPRTESANDETRLTAPSPLDALRAMVAFDVDGDTSPFAVFAAGVFAYDFVDTMEALPLAKADPLGLPDAVFFLAESVVVVDKTANVSRVFATAFGDDRTKYHDAEQRIAVLVAAVATAAGLPQVTAAAADAATINVDLSDHEFEQLVDTLKTHIVAGDVFQIVGSRSFSVPCADPFSAYIRLRELNPSPYQFIFTDDDSILFGASPETCVRVDVRNGKLTVHVHPLAGSRRRGKTPDEDDRIEADLRLSEKEVAEHMMLVDLARNDIARVAVPGTRRVSPLLGVERYSHIMHLVSHVSGQLRPGLDALHAYGASANMGTLVGAPKLRAAELLRHYEGTKRGVYGGAIAWLAHDGSFDSAIIIRSALVRDGVAHVRAGAGVVFDSDPKEEMEETKRKAAAVLRAIGGVA